MTGQHLYNSYFDELGWRSGGLFRLYRRGVIPQRLDGQRPVLAQLLYAGEVTQLIGDVKATQSCVARRHGGSKLLVIVLRYYLHARTLHTVYL